MTGSRGESHRRWRNRLDPAWVAASALLLWTLGEVVLPAQLPGRSAGSYWAWGGVGVAIFAALLLARDAAESWAASRRARPRGELVVAGIGLAVTLSLAVLAALVGWSIARSGGSVLAAGALFYVATVSLAVAATELLPGLSPHGGKLLHAAIWHWTGDAAAATRIAFAVGKGAGLGLALIGLWLVLGPQPLAGAWLLTLGGMLLSARWRAALPEGYDSSPRRALETPVREGRGRWHLS